MSDPASDDPFEVIGEIPSGLAYQWCVLAVMGDSTLGGNCIEAYKRDGWGPVPRKRHPRMRHQGHWIIVHDCLLIQKPKRLVEATQAEDIAIARQQMDDARAMYGFPPTQDDRPRIGFEVGLLSQPVAGVYWTKDEFFNAKTALKEIGDHRVCEVAILVTVSDNEIENALYLKLDPAEYVRRRIIMDTDVLMRRPFLSSRDQTVFSRAELQTKLINDGATPMTAEGRYNPMNFIQQ